MHEFGHTAGLAHSIVDVDSSPAGHEYATMNFVGTVDGPLTVDVAVPRAAPTYGYTNATITTTGTFFGGYAAREAETLSLDDRCALIEGYPGAALTSTLGGISGQVFHDPAIVGSTVFGLRGAHVVAFDPEDPNRRRVGRISFNQGNFAITGLEPGIYSLMVEPVDIGGYLPPTTATLPAIVATPPFTNFFTELWGGPSGEAHVEAGLHQVFANVQVVAGAITQNVDIRIQARPAGRPDPLTVVTSSQLGPLGSVPPPIPFVLGPSAHGIQVPVGNANAFPTTVTPTIDAGVANAGQLCYVFGSLTSGRTDVGPYSSTAGTSYLQLYVLDAAAPVITPVFLDGAGTASLPFVLPVGFGLTSFLVQAMYFDTTVGHFVLSNKVSVRTAFP